jgi:hypothetical protein
MTYSRYVYQCPWDGCRVRSTLASYREKHAEMPHSLCSCGWVGTYCKMHVASQRRAGNTGEHAWVGPARRRAEP